LFIIEISDVKNFICGLFSTSLLAANWLVVICGDLVVICGDLMVICGNLVVICGDLVVICGDLVEFVVVFAPLLHCQQFPAQFAACYPEGGDEMMV